MKNLIRVFILILFFFTKVHAQSDLLNKKELQNGAQQILLGERDPFQRPKYLDELEAEEMSKSVVESTEDERVEAIRRWSLKEYKPIAVMWDVQNPKVMVLDRKNTMHLLKKNYRIGNKNGIITAINEGEIIVTEKGIPHVMKIEKPGK